MAEKRLKYPIGIQTFSEIREENYLYVDKTEFVFNMVHDYKFVFLSRPRRFGKSLLVSTLASYFRGEKELFEGLAIDKLESEWKQYPVIHLSLASVKAIETEGIIDVIDYNLALIEQEYGIPSVTGDLGKRLKNIIVKCKEKYGEKTVVVLDEYDAPLLNVIHDPEKLQEVRQLMRILYSPLKDCDRYLRFVFLTGISKFSQLSIFSEINNIKNISMMPEYSTICGFTQEELEYTFTAGIDKLAERQEMTREQALEKLKTTYDGYHFCENSPGVYNPFSIINSMSDGAIKNYWFSTGTPTFLVNMLRKFNTDISKIDGSTSKAGQFDAPTEGMTSVLPLFYQSGYLTIKDYYRTLDTYTLGFPNKEVRDGLMEALYPFYVTHHTDSMTPNLDKICLGFMHGDPETSFQVLKAYLESIPYQDSKFDENHYTQMMYVIFSILGVNIQSQVRTANGRIDAVVSTKDYIYVIEVKLNDSPEKALEQIDKKDYLLPYTLDDRKLFKIGVEFTTGNQERKIKEWIIKPVN